MRWWHRFRRRRRDVLDCHEVAAVLQQHLDGELDHTTADAVAAHLEDCRRCGMEAETYQHLKARLAGLGAPVDEDSVRRLRDFVDRLTEEPPNRP
jgi:anti-sigma factor RsiW